MRILHISDFHATGSREPDANVILDQFFHALRVLHGSTPIDLVVFTGDITQQAAAEEFELARTQLLEPILAVTGLASTRLLLAPGNHDVDRGAIDRWAEGGLQQISDRETLNGIIDNEGEYQRVAARSARAVEFCRTFGPEPVLTTPTSTSYEMQFGEQSVLVSCVNSAWRASGVENDTTDRLLLVGDREIRRHAESVGRANLSILAIHHPLEWLAEFDQADVRFVAEQSYDLVLTGHTHREEPVSITTRDGRTTYSRAGSLYQSRRLPNSFTIIDLAGDLRTADLVVHQISPQAGGSFEPKTPLSVEFGAQLSLDGISPRPQYADVLDHLAHRVKASAVVAEMTADLDGTTLSDLLVQPVLLPIDYATWTRTRRPDSSVEGARIEEAVATGSQRCVVVAGGRECGLTSSLVWLLYRSYVAAPGRLPLLLKWREIGKGASGAEEALKVARASAGYELTSDELLLVAIDDVDAMAEGHLERVLEYFAAHPEIRLLLGCREDVATAVFDRAAGKGLDPTSAFVAPFGAAELRSIVRRVAPDHVEHSVNVIMRLLHTHNLPRTPFLMGALAYLVAAGVQEFHLRNESAVLDRYVRLLLGSGNLFEAPSTGLDETDREHLLAALAAAYYARDRPAMSVQEVERFLLTYFESAGWSKLSAGSVLASFEARRVLQIDGTEVRFRHASFQDLFVAKQMARNGSFFDEVMSHPLDAIDPARHLAALKRDDERLLDLAVAAFEAEFSPIRESLPVELFNEVEVVPGFSSATDPAQLAAANRLHRARSSEERNADSDRMWQEVEANAPSAEDGPAEEDSWEPGERLPAALDLLCAVLRNSDHILDVKLKGGLLAQALLAWSAMYTAVAVAEDETGDAMRLADHMLSVLRPTLDPTDPRREQLLNEIVQVFLAAAMGGAVEAALGTTKLAGALEMVVDDEPFMSSPAPALLATMLYCDLKLAGWVARLESLLEQHGGHSVVREVVRHYARYHYYYGVDLTNGQVKALERAVVGATIGGSGLAGEPPSKRLKAENSIRTDLQQGRNVARLKALGGG